MRNLIFALVCAVFVFGSAVGQIQYPEHVNIDKRKQNQAGRIPLYSPSRCGKNELLFPGDQQNDWICDCAPGALYHPESDACFPAFRKGPCAQEHMLVLRPNQVIPECIPNICKTDGHIQINNNCYEFGKGAPCKNANLHYVLGVDPKTLMVDCVPLSMAVATRFEEIEAAINYDISKAELCARGTKYSSQGLCTKV